MSTNSLLHIWPDVVVGLSLCLAGLAFVQWQRQRRQPRKTAAPSTPITFACYFGGYSIALSCLPELDRFSLSSAIFDAVFALTLCLEYRSLYSAWQVSAHPAREAE